MATDAGWNSEQSRKDDLENFKKKLTRHIEGKNSKRKDSVT